MLDRPSPLTAMAGLGERGPEEFPVPLTAGALHGLWALPRRLRRFCEARACRLGMGADMVEACLVSNRLMLKH